MHSHIVQCAEWVQYRAHTDTMAMRRRPTKTITWGYDEFSRTWNAIKWRWKKSRATFVDKILVQMNSHDRNSITHISRYAILLYGVNTEIDGDRDPRFGIGAYVAGVLTLKRRDTY